MRLNLKTQSALVFLGSFVLFSLSWVFGVHAPQTFTEFLIGSWALVVAALLTTVIYVGLFGAAFIIEETSDEKKV